MEEDGDPAAGAVLAQAHLEALVRHADDDEADARPGVEPPVDEVQLTCTVAHELGGERGAQEALTQFLLHGDGEGLALRDDKDRQKFLP